MGQADAGDNEAKVLTKLAPEWVRTSDPVIRSQARYRWTTAPAGLCMKDIIIYIYILMNIGVIRTAPGPYFHTTIINGRDGTPGRYFTTIYSKDMICGAT